MRSATAMSLRNRIARLFWEGNTIVCAFVALHGVLMCFGVLGYNAPLSALSVPLGALLAATGVLLTAFSLWKVRPLSRD